MLGRITYQLEDLELQRKNDITTSGNPAPNGWTSPYKPKFPLLFLQASQHDWQH